MPLTRLVLVCSPGSTKAVMHGLGLLHSLGYGRSLQVWMLDHVSSSRSAADMEAHCDYMWTVEARLGLTTAESILRIACFSYYVECLKMTDHSCNF